MMDRLGVFYEEIEALKTRLAKYSDEATTLFTSRYFKTEDMMKSPEQTDKTTKEEIAAPIDEKMVRLIT